MAKIEKLIQSLEGNPNPDYQFIGRSLREVYYSGKYRAADITGLYLDDIPLSLQALKVIALQDKRVKAVVLDVVNGSPSPELYERFASVSQRHFIPHVFDALRDEAVSALETEGLQTLGVLQMSRILGTERESIAILYPKVFIGTVPNPLPRMLGLDAQDIAAGISMGFHRLTPLRG